MYNYSLQLRELNSHLACRIWQTAKSISALSLSRAKAAFKLMGTGQIIREPLQAGRDVGTPQTLWSSAYHKIQTQVVDSESPEEHQLWAQNCFAPLYYTTSEPSCSVHSRLLILVLSVRCDRCISD